MTARGQQNFGVAPEVAGGGSPSSLDVGVANPCMEQNHNLRPLRQRFGESSSSRDGALTNENSPRFICVQGAQQAYSSGGALVDPSGFYQYEDFAGILGERLASCSLSDVSASASEKVGSGYSSSGEHHGPRVKLMCSFGGRILPRPGDGRLRYVGGDTRIISVYRHTKYNDLMHKMGRLYGQPVVLKYQLPNEDLDALISISCDDDVENMMDEYDRLQAREGSNRLRIFLFLPADYDAVHTTSPVDIRNTDQIYMDAINGMPETRPISVVPLSYSSILSGPDTLGATQIPTNLTYVLPVVSNPQLASSLVQSVLIQSSKPVMSRVLSASPSTPPSPTVASQVPAIRQPGIAADAGHLYADQLLKGHVAHVHELQQRVDGAYQDMEGVGSRTSSLNSQHDGHYRHFEAMRITDSPKKSQNEGMVDQPHYQEQMFVADSLLPRAAPTNVLPQVDSSYGRMPRVGSNKSLLSLQQQQQPEVLGTFMSDRTVDRYLSEPLQPALDVQNPILQEQVFFPPAAWHHNRETRREDFQRLDPVRLTASQAPQIVSPVVITSHEMAAYNQHNQSSGAMSSTLLQKPLSVQTSFRAPSILHPGMGQVSASPLHPGSAPSSPRVTFQEMNVNSTGIHPVLVGRGGFTGGFVEQPSPQLIAQPPIEPAFRGLKPLNIRRDPREQVPLGDDLAGRQQLSSPLLKHQEIRGAFRKPEGDDVHNFYSDGLTEARTPPYVGGSPYHEHPTPFADHRLLRRDEQGQVQEQVPFDSGFAGHSNVHEGIDWAMRRPENEKTTMRWTGLGQIDLRGEASSYVTNSSASGSSPAFSTSDLSFIDPVSNDAAKFDSHVFSRTSFTPPAVAGPPPIFDRVRISSSSAQAPSSNEALYTVPDMLGTVREDPVLKAAPQPALSMSPKTTNPNSFFITDLEEGPWIKGVQDDVRMPEDSPRLENKLQMNDSLYFGGGLSRQISDKDMHSQDEQIGLSVVEGGNFKGSRSKSNDALDANMRCKSNEALNANVQLLASHGNHNSVDISNSLLSPLSPRMSMGNLGLGCPSPSVTLEPLSHLNCLAEDASLVSSPRLSIAVEAKVDDFPIFDSASVEEDEIRFIGSSEASANADIEFLPPTLFTAPTLSMQNWEENLSTMRSEELATEKGLLDKNLPDNLDNLEVLVSKREALEVSVGVVADDLEGANVNLAVLAEAEAVSRGLQTIKNADLEELRELGTGTFGTVYHGKWRGTDVAIKRIKSSCFSGRPSERDRLIADFWKEAYILGQLHHPNVVAFYGVVPDGPGGTLATVTEYMVNGSLKQVLQKKDRTIDRRKRLLIIMDAAFGMEYLHGKNIVHFDLKCENLLVNMKDPQRPICKVGDLGLSKVKHQTMVSGGVRGTLPWMAPELLNGSSSLVSEKVDVFSFGIVMWELLTGEEPYVNMHYGAIIGGIVNNTLRPPVPSWCDPAWKSLMEKCWSADPAERPSFLEISAELRTMANARTQGQASGAVSGDSTK